MRHDSDESVDSSDSEEIASEISTRPNAIEKLCLEYQQHPENEELKLRVVSVIKKLYIKTGGVPIVTTSVVPPNLVELKPEQMVNAIDNLMIYTNRTKKNDLIGKCFNIFSNFSMFFAKILQVPVKSKLFDMVSEDTIFRDSIVAVFLGHNISPSPATTLLISAASHLSNALPLYKAVEPEQTEKPRVNDRSQV